MWSRVRAWLALFAFFYPVAASADDPISLGPIPIDLSINNIDIEAPLSAKLSTDSRGGVLNADGVVDISIATGPLAGRLQAVADSVLPYKYHTTACDIMLKKLSNIKVTSVSHEARLAASADLSPEHCSAPDMNVSFEIALMPVWIDKSTIRFRIPRDPKIVIPLFWRIPARLFVGDLGKIARKNIQEFLDKSEQAKLMIPPREGINAAFQGTNFSARAGLLIFRIVGDAHINSSALQKILLQAGPIPKISLVIKPQ